jgi:hypothetical protein
VRRPQFELAVLDLSCMFLTVDVALRRTIHSRLFHPMPMICLTCPASARTSEDVRSRTGTTRPFGDWTTIDINAALCELRRAQHCGAWGPVRGTARQSASW